MVRKAIVDDVAAIHAIVDGFAKKGVMLQRPASDIYNHLRDFFVYEENGAILGTCALHICSEEMGEVRSLAVKDGYTGRGIGRKLVEECLREARALRLKKVFALTYKTGFFQKLGFNVIQKEVLPNKIWGDCIKCIKFPSCDEVAVLLEL